MSQETRLGASFRDPSGFVFRREGVVYRRVNDSYRQDYDLMMSSGLYQSLVDDGLLIPHVEVTTGELCTSAIVQGGYKLLKPQQVPFISYPYEWSFSQLKDAALVTLDLQQRALEHGQWLKDASAYNIQFLGVRPVFIDTLSFEAYPEGQPWVAYHQFCKHFLAPLALMSRGHIDMGRLLALHIDGVPLDVASKLLSWKTRLSLGLLTHLHAHAWAIEKHQDTTGAGASASATVKNGETGPKPGRQMSKTGLVGLIGNLRATVEKLTWRPTGTEWGDYYAATNYTDAAQRDKQKIIDGFLDSIQPQQVWDLGANTGLFSRLAAARGITTCAFDIDPAAVELNYRAARDQSEKNLLPLLMDLRNPSPELGWNNDERFSLSGRGPADLVMALALVHHLAISNNVPLAMVACYLARLGRSLIIEFVPKSDSQVRRLLASREDVFPDYTQKGFEAAFAEQFTQLDSIAVAESDRTLYLFTARQS